VIRALLLDTHVFLWWRTNDGRLQPAVQEAIGMAELVFVSAASAWEAHIKMALGKLELPEAFSNGVAASGFNELAISFSHVETAARLPAHHRDPFDRQLIAQAQHEQLVLVSHDRALAPYGAAMLWT
jgi:PIN domain nuclease of toxin-antitoxin system